MMTNNDYYNIAKRVISKEADALSKLSQNIPDDFYKIVDYLLPFKAKIIFSGVGKSGHIARKMAASFSSTGIASLYLHPVEASHGDLGIITCDDFVIVLSNSGETKELFNLIEYCQNLSIKIATITMNPNSNLALKSDFLLTIPRYEEASEIGAPTISSLLMLSLGDALMTVIHEKQGFTINDFQKHHPGGSINANLTKILHLMRKNEQLPLVYDDTSFTEATIIMNQKCLGCAIVVDKNMHLVGIVTDGDLRRHIKDINTKSVLDIMTKDPIYISSLTLAKDALHLMKNKKITSLPVVNDNIIIGVIHIYDLLTAGVTN